MQGSGSLARFIIGGGDVSNGSGFINIKLACDGKGIFKEPGVLPGANWPDPVFAINYCLPSLTEEEPYISTEKHLPEVPSQEEIKEKGVDVMKMNKIRVKKVEELTLHLIRLEKEIEALKTGK